VGVERTTVNDLSIRSLLTWYQEGAILVIRFFQVVDQGEPYALAALSDQVRPGWSRLYRWIPNDEEWVRDDGLLRDFRGFAMDRLNEFVEVSPAEAAERAAEMQQLSAQWILAQYRAVSERLSAADLGL
jgi:hypothetical protein